MRPSETFTNSRESRTAHANSHGNPSGIFGAKSTQPWVRGEKPPPLELKSDTRYFITSLEAEERSAARLTQAIRGHLSVENRNHWKRDTSL